jgi:hypothetical protein
VWGTDNNNDVSKVICSKKSSKLKKRVKINIKNNNKKRGNHHARSLAAAFPTAPLIKKLLFT